MSRTRGLRACALLGSAALVVAGVAGDFDRLRPAAGLRGGQFVVDEPQPIHLDGSATDDFEGAATLTVHDPVAGLRDAASHDIVVRNVPPAVEAVAVSADEGGTGAVSATVAGLGDDTLAAEIDWGDGSGIQAVPVSALASGVGHRYGDDGSYPVTVTVTDGDGGVGAYAVPLDIVSVDPVVALDVGGTVTFPGGDYAVTAAAGVLHASAKVTDAGSDDLAFTWSTGDETAFANDGVSPDPPLSPSGTFPVVVSDAIDAKFAAPGVETLRLVVTDDDHAVTDASARVVVTGAAHTAFGRAWWLHEYAGTGRSQVGPAHSARYLDIVQAVSTVFSELEPVTTSAQAVAVLSPRGDGWRAQARAELLCAWLDFASGAVPWDATVALDSGAKVAFLDLMAVAEADIASSTTTDDELRQVAADLSRARQAAG